MRRLSIFNSPFSTGLVWGSIGGLAAILIAIIYSGPLMMLPYFVFLSIAVMAVNLDKGDKKYNKLFSTTFWAFITITIIAFLNTTLFTATPTNKLSFSYYLFVIPLMLLIAIAVSAILPILVTHDPDRPRLRSLFRNSVVSALFWGFIGGLLLILTLKLTKGAGLVWFFIPYATAMFLSTLTLNITTSKNKYISLFIAASLTYIVMSLILLLYNLSVYKDAAQEFPMIPYLKSLAISIIWGIAASLGLAFLLTRKR